MLGKKLLGWCDCVTFIVWELPPKLTHRAWEQWHVCYERNFKNHQSSKWIRQQAILNIIWNWKSPKMRLQKHLRMLSILIYSNYIMCFGYNLFDTQWFDICWLEMSTKSTFVSPPFSAYPHSIPKGVAKRSQTFANHACRRWPGNQAISVVQPLLV